MVYLDLSINKATIKNKTIVKKKPQFQIHSGPNKAVGSSPCQLKVLASNGPITETNNTKNAADTAKLLTNVDMKFILLPVLSVLVEPHSCPSS